MESIFESIFTLEFALVTLGVYVTFVTLKKSFPELFAKKWARKLLPLVTLVVPTLMFGFVPGLSSFTSLSARIMQGLICGWAAQNVHNIMSGLKKDDATPKSVIRDLLAGDEEKEEKLEQPEEPTDESDVQ